MSQSHLVIDFPIKGPANAKVLAEELPALMPDLAAAQDDLGTVHFSRFMVEGDEKLLFLSDIDGEVDQHIERLVESVGPVFDGIFEHVDDPPATPVADNPEGVVKWLKRNVREPMDTYFAYEDASVQDIKASARAGGFTGNTSQAPLLTYMAFKSGLQAFALKLVGGPWWETRDIKRRILLGRCISPIGCPLSTTTSVSSRSTTVISRSTSRTSQTRPRSFSMLSFRMSLARRQPRSQRTPRRSISGHWQTTIHRSGFQRLSRLLGSRHPSSDGRSKSQAAPCEAEARSDSRQSAFFDSVDSTPSSPWSGCVASAPSPNRQHEDDCSFGLEAATPRVLVFDHSGSDLSLWTRARGRLNRRRGCWLRRSRTPSRRGQTLVRGG